MVAQQTLTLFVWVQILVPLPTGQGPGAYVCPRLLFFMPAGNKPAPRRGVAQFGRALRSGRRSRRFKSCHLDHALTPRNGLTPPFLGVFVLPASDKALYTLCAGLLHLVGAVAV